MKVIVDIPQEYLEMAKCLSLATSKTDKQEEDIVRFAEIAMKTEDIIKVDPHDLFEDDKVTMKSLYIQFALLAIAGISKQKES